MLGRLTYYLERFRRRQRNLGWAGALSETGGFLRRRRFFVGFLAEAWEYQVSSRFRGLLKTERKTQELKPFGSCILIYVSYDRDSIVRPHVIEQLRFFFERGYSTVFVTTSLQFPQSEAAKLSPYVSRFIHRENIGYDYASYRLGFEGVRDFALRANSMIVMNDSCLGPRYDWSAQLAAMVADTASVFGITKSYEITEYVQSYFFHFGRDLLRAGTIGRYFDRVRILHRKWAIVRYYEIGGSRWLRRRGIPLKALVDPARPEVRELMQAHQLTDPTRDPVATILEQRRLLPLRKRSLSAASAP